MGEELETVMEELGVSRRKLKGSQKIALQGPRSSFYDNTTRKDDELRAPGLDIPIAKLSSAVVRCAEYPGSNVCVSCWISRLGSFSK